MANYYKLQKKQKSSTRVVVDGCMCLSKLGKFDVTLLLTS
jgi:hypothetical protein